MNATALRLFGAPDQDTLPHRLLPLPGSGAVLLLGATGFETESGHSRGLVLLRLNDEGGPEWTRAFPADAGWGDATLEANGGILVALRGVGPEPLGDADFAPSAGELAIVKVDLLGNLVWVRRFATTTGDGLLTSVVTTAQGTVLVAGAFREGLVDGAAVLEVRPPHCVGHDAFVLELGPEGSVIWHRSLGASSCLVRRMVIDEEGNVFVFGAFSGSLSLGNGSVEAGPGTHVFAAKLDPSRHLLWSSTTLGDAGRHEGTGAVGPDGAAYVAGTFRGRLDWGDQHADSSAIGDAFLGRLGSTGAAQELFVFGNGRPIEVHDLAVGPTGSVLLTGTFSGQVDFGGITTTAQAIQDMYVARYASVGAASNLLRHGLSGTHSGTQLAAVGPDTWLAAGYASGEALVGTTPIASAGAIDSVLIRLTP